ncbi:MAG: T9SS type A sorting domain-containing protein, partial [Saprospiraceae bacterium]|nr:T9SS type A sorting domain-containing protein [Saprospiraceae bacterium]
LNVNYKIIDWMGSVKGKGRVEELSSSIDVAAFSPGIYILSVENEKEIYFQKFIVQ